MPGGNKLRDVTAQAIPNDQKMRAGTHYYVCAGCRKKVRTFQELTRFNCGCGHILMPTLPDDYGLYE